MRPPIKRVMKNIHSTLNKMYPIGSLIAELQTARRRLLNVFELPVSTATDAEHTECATEAMGCLTRIKNSMDVPRLTTAVI
jgi:hypothetical protein